MKKRKIPFSVPYIDEREIREVVKVLRGKWITTGPEVKKFEARVCKFLQVKHAVAVASGTAALDVSLSASGLQRGDEIITTPYTFASTVLSIIHRGGTPVLVDVEPDTFNIDPEKIDNCVSRQYELTSRGLRSRNTGQYLRGIIPVHFGGQPADLDRIMRMARKYKLFVIEDAAHALGSKYHGVPIGKSHNLVCFSFYSNKNLTTGEGGMIVTDQDEIIDRLRMISLHGISTTAAERYKRGIPLYDVVFPGFKYNLTDIQAALGVAQLGKIQTITRLRCRVAQWYDNLLAEIPEVSVPIIKAWNFSCRHLYPILLKPELKNKRDQIIRELKSQGVYCSIHFIPIHFHTFFRKYFNPSLSLPVAEDLFFREISLPIFPELKKDDIRYIATALKNALRKTKK